jgi:hypothetical protein
MKAVGRKAVKAQGARFAAAAELFWREPDAMHALLVNRADALVGCTEGSPEELRALADVLEATRRSAGLAARRRVARGERN